MVGFDDNASRRSFVSPTGKMKESATKWMEKIKLDSAMKGAAYKFELYQLQRCLDALTKGEANHADIVAIKSHQQAALAAIELCRMEKLSEERRSELLTSLTRAGVEAFPPNIQAGLLGCRVKSLIGTKPLPCSALVDIMRFTDSKEEFKPHAPRLQDTEVDSTEQAKVFVRVMVVDGMVALVSSERLADLKLLCTTLQEECAKMHAATAAVPAVMEALDEVIACAAACMGLIEPQQASSAVAAVDMVLQSNRGGRVILKQALITTKFFKEAEGKLRCASVAEASLGPVLGKAKSDLKEL